MTAPALTNTRPVVAKITADHNPRSRPPRSAPSAQTSAPHAIMKSSDGKRAPNSSTPNTDIEIADAHVDSGGLPQNGTP